MAKKKKKKNADTLAPPGEESSSKPPAETEAPHDPAGDKRLLKMRIGFFGIALVGAVADVLSKYGVFSLLSVKVDTIKGTPVVTSSEELRIFGEALKFQGAINTGAVFGMFQGRWLFLILFTVIALGIIGWVLFRSRNLGIATVAGLGLVCAGALGNLWDRFLFNGVRDFIVFTCSLLEPFIKGGRWPTFNIADAWICIGIPLILLGDFLTSRHARKEVGLPEGTLKDAKGAKKGRNCS